MIRLIACPSPADVAEASARQLALIFEGAGFHRVGLATGKTMVPVYEALVRLLAKAVPKPHIETFNLDEYWPLDPAHPGSFRSFMERYVFRPLAPYLAATQFLNGEAPYPERECQRYEDLLSKRPLHLQVLGIGVNGHIGFNEPGTPFQSRTRRVRLSENTRRQNQPGFPGELPYEALTMGIANIMEARSILLVAFGDHKREALVNALWGPVTEECPASVLQLHENVTVIADRAALGEA
ncbi:glucosamine-6-phosphate deaminase [Sulfobacillus acidophilus TPY]|uniref:Glucosamine-6-phosphate deaminase n=1 Tax=Sulfobacillus acidophilus (strain ATCC 700253 / DSM 10332 / NAL) TaxID=679936 RepID=G8TU60_SULAD|nr:glucosamine-6-phosphate deaminase [Sulfobacillus acidophilus TPY]AEW05732.1 Glucosamine-6-phosphate deaminase [Sulfobacillus acidophilus DSM 10332]